jgi:predicted transcriptional regulator
VFQLAVQLAQLEQREAIDTIAQGARFDDETARELFLYHLTGYFAAALIMPYGRFLRACDATDYDLPVLQRRFGVSFEQLAHRLTTLQRVGQRGLPFFMVRLDRAGQFSKRIVGASGAELIEAEHSCPLWIAHKAFERSGDLLVQTGQLARRWQQDGYLVHHRAHRRGDRNRERGSGLRCCSGSTLRWRVRWRRHAVFRCGGKMPCRSDRAVAVVILPGASSAPCRRSAGACTSIR